ncbi:prepilin peptidase CpaA [Paraburkholderia fungorum]|uniref:Prepilin peptidase CpaA n=1 Tax=Paraburkholderia fungorum TaxID=134537 RepID=A0A1H1IV01_9BURK|nr:prepilin peptidase [Paraburkholderia fungorum]SDR41542.1 prepilin peptidase CpaA [Paraburkholderia fungorum]
MTPLPLPPQPVPLCVIVLVIVAASTDIVTRRIPNRVIAIGLVAALGVQLWLHGLANGALAWLAGAACGFALLLPFYLVRGMAAGDVKLLLTVGAWVGPVMTFHIALVTLVIGGVWSVGLVVGRRRVAQLLINLRQILTPQTSSSGGRLTASVGSIPYGVAIAAGTLGMLFAATFP